jgi:hypothetical protein
MLFIAWMFNCRYRRLPVKVLHVQCASAQLENCRDEVDCKLVATGQKIHQWVYLLIGRNLTDD